MSAYFNTTSKGEIYELKQQLDSNDKSTRKDAVKRVIAAMTVGKDVEMLFVDVMKCMQTNDLEMKKLVYLYLINYARLKSDLAILSTCSFTRDCQDPNPLIRALALRTITCLRVESILEYMCEPLQKALTDLDPYVRKTAAICVAKIHQLNPALADEYGLLEGLAALMTDANPMVMSNCIAVITEILQTSTKLTEYLNVNFDLIKKLLFTVCECSEWGQIYILDFISTYRASTPVEAKIMIQRVVACFAHANAAVVMSAVRVVMQNFDLLEHEDVENKGLMTKLQQPVIRLLSDKPEIQYVTLRNLKLILKKFPDFMKESIRVLFVKYNDPLYIKMEKIDLLIMVCDHSNVHLVLSEIQHYSTEVDVDFVQRSVRSIGNVAIAVQKSADNCVKLLLEMLESKVEYVMQMCVVVFMDIFRRYPNKYERVLETLAGVIDEITEPEAKAAMVWIVGEYAEKIVNADELLEMYLEEFENETQQVQLQLLTACVKLFLRKPQNNHDLIQTVLQLATDENVSPDLRDRGYIYWRLLSTDPAAAKEVVLKEKPLISNDRDIMEPSLLTVLIDNISTLASVYHKHPKDFTDAPQHQVSFGSGSRPRSVSDVVGELDSHVPPAPVSPDAFNQQQQQQQQTQQPQAPPVLQPVQQPSPYQQQQQQQQGNVIIADLLGLDL